jgi:hypothetical protein
VRQTMRPSCLAYANVAFENLFFPAAFIGSRRWGLAERDEGRLA